jgi:ADP-dependent NAD(P)H-hydrate dehydratase / NAD(P)H-hydrate epimerase
MFLPTSQQIKEWDQFTIKQEPVASIDLMERAAAKCFEWIESQRWQQKQFRIFCGKGNNGGDGLVIARLLFQKNYKVSVYILELGKAGSADFQTNLERLHDLSFDELHFIQSAEQFPTISSSDIVIDALFGSGLNKPLTDLPATLVGHMNISAATIISIDVPSGLFMDRSSKGNTVVEADHTLTFQTHKMSLLVQENAPFIGDVHVFDIGLHPGFPETIDIHQEILDPLIIRQIFRPRNRFSHKGAFGHALLVAGSYGKMGAAVLAAKACIHSGVGLLTCDLPQCGYNIMQTAVPEAMVVTGEALNTISLLPGEIEKYSCIGIGPGIGTADETRKIVSFIIRRYHKPLVIDADGLNCIALQKDLLDQLHPFSVLTPHPKEFDRLFGNHENDFDRIDTAKNISKLFKCIIVLKGHHTLIATPAGQCYFNSTGNAGMAKGGSGDVLTGIITSLIAQGYSPLHAALLGVYIHGLAGDLAAKALSQEFMTPTNLIQCLSQAFRDLDLGRFQK